jgi:hypothetical protein
MAHFLALSFAPYAPHLAAGKNLLLPRYPYLLISQFHKPCPHSQRCGAVRCPLFVVSGLSEVGLQGGDECIAAGFQLGQTSGCVG